MANVVSKGMNGRAKTVERATEVCLVLCELEVADVVVEALLKGTQHKVPKLALASVEALLKCLSSFGTPTVIPAKPILKGIAHMFDSKDGKVRDTAKELTVEMVRWLGVEVCKKDLIEKLRPGMQAEVAESISKIVLGTARATRLTRKEQTTGALLSEPMEVDQLHGDDYGNNSELPGSQPQLPEAYEFADPFSILDKLEKPLENKEQPKFWDAITSSKWKERLGALTQLKQLASNPKLASSEYGDVTRALKKIITKDSNIACVGEACACAGALAEGLRKEFRSDAKLLLPGMLDKLKDKNTSVVTKNRDALCVFSKRCVSIVDVSDEIVAALNHKFPKVPAQTLGWVKDTFSKNPDKATAVSSHKFLLPAIVKAAEHKDKDVRAAVIDALAALANAGGGFKSIAKQIDAIDKGKKTKVEEAVGLMGGGGGKGVQKPLVVVDVNKHGTAVVTTAGTAVGKSTQAGAKPRLPGAAARVSGNASQVTSVTAGDDVAPAPALSKEETSERLSALYGPEVVTQLGSANWKERLAGTSTVVEQINVMDVATANGAAESTVRGLNTLPGFDDKNFQVLGKVFEAFGALAGKATSFSKKDGACVVQGIAEKLVDVKLRGPGSVALTNVAEALGPAFVFSQLRSRADGHKNPKVTSESLLFCAGAIFEFGVHACGVALAIDWCKASLGLTNPQCKAAAAKMLGVMHAGLGPGLKDFLQDVKESTMKTLEAEFVKNPFDGNGKVWRTVRVVESTAVSTSSDSGGSDGLPRADISPLITEKLIGDMADTSGPTSWKIRAAAVESVGSVLAGAGFRIAPSTGDLLPALMKRFNDSNRNLAVQALAMAGKVAVAVGPAIAERRHGHGVAGEITKQMGDSKPAVRSAASAALDAWVIATGLEKTLPIVADKMVYLAPKMSGDGKAEALGWVLAALLSGEFSDDAEVLTSAIAAASVGLVDNKSQARAAGVKVLDHVLKCVGSNRTAGMVNSLKCAKQMKQAAATHVEKAGVVVGDSGSGMVQVPEPSASPTLPSRPATARAGIGHKSTTGISSLRASRPGTAREGLASSMSSFSAPAAPEGGVLRRNDDKDGRLKKLPKKPVKFETLRDDQLQIAEGEVKLSMAPYVRSDVHALLFQDFKAHLVAIEILEKSLQDDRDNVLGNLDLLLRWVVLRFMEQTPNTQSLLKVLDFTQQVLRVVKDNGARLTEQEGALFLPALVDKSGHAMEAVREKFRAVLRLVPGLFPASRLAGYLVRGLGSKNTKTKMEALDALELLVERHGLDVVERGGSKALQEIAKLADARDAPTRAAALTCLTTSYKVAGEGAWKHIGRVGPLVKEALEDKFAKAAKEMAKKNEGTPGAWSRGGVIVGGGAGNAAAVGAVPLPSALAGKSVSRSVATPGRLAATATAVGSPIAAVASALLRPIGKAVSSLARRDRHERAGESWLEEHPVECNDEDDEIMDVRLQGWRRALATVATGTDAVAVEGMKQLCHEVMGAVGDDVMLTAMAPDVDTLVKQLALRVAPIFDAAAAAPGPSTARACRYVLNALMQVMQCPALANAVGQKAEHTCIGTLLTRLLDPRAPEMEEGPALVKALNVLMLKVLEHCQRMNSFNVLLRLLATPPVTVAKDEHLTQRFHELVVKCLIKLTKALGTTLHEVDVPTLLLEIHTFFHTLGEAEIRKRGGAPDRGDKPLRMVKTILHKVTEMLGHDVHDQFTLCPGRDTTPTPIIYAYVDLNLQSMPNARGVPRVFQKEQAARIASEASRIPSVPQVVSPTISAPKTVAAPVVVATQSTPDAVQSPATRPEAPKSAQKYLQVSKDIQAGLEKSSPVAEPVAPAPVPPVVTRPAAPATPVPTPSAELAPTVLASTPKNPKTPKASLLSVDGPSAMDVDTIAVPPTPVSADLKSQLANVFKKIGEKTTTGSGLEDLYDFSKQYPMVDIQPHLARTSAAFQSYIQRGLNKVEAARAKRAAAIAAATPRRAAVALAAPAPPIAPSPMPQMERTAAEVYRERLAQMAQSKKDRERRLSGGLAKSNAPTASNQPTRLQNITNTDMPRISSASAGLTTLRERMNRIAAKAAGGGSGGSSDVSAPKIEKTSEQQVTFEDLQARMERIRANSAAGKF